MSTPEQKTTQMNRILFDAPYFFRKDDDKRLTISSFPFIVEEMIANGAVAVAVPDMILLPNELDRLPAPLRKRVNTVDKRAKVAASCHALLAPVCEEFGLEFERPPYFIYRLQKDQPQDVNKALHKLVADLYPLLVGIECQLQVFFDVKDMRHSISTLRSHSRNLTVKSTLATLAGILSTYKSLSVGSVQAVSSATVPLINTFEQLIKDATFQAISQESHSLGFPMQAKLSALQLGCLFKKLLSKPRFKALLKLTSKLVSAATSLPTPTAELGEALLKSKYLPPALPVSALKRILFASHYAWQENCARVLNK